MSFDILREWDLESFDPGLEYFPDTVRSASVEIATPAANDSNDQLSTLPEPNYDEMAREAAIASFENLSAGTVASEGNFDFDITDPMEQEWADLSAARAQEDRDDLERERAGVGKKHERFGVEDRDGKSAQATQRAAMADMAQMQAQQQAQTEMQNTFNEQNIAASKAFREQLEYYNQLIAQAQADYDAYYDSTLMLNNGTRVFETNNGDLVDADGNALSELELREVQQRIAEGETVNNHEILQGKAEFVEQTIEDRNQVKASIQRLEDIDKRVQRGEITIEQGLEEQETIINSMPPEVRERYEGELEAAQNEPYLPKETLNADNAEVRLDLSSLSTQNSTASLNLFGDNEDITTSISLATEFELASYDIEKTTPETPSINNGQGLNQNDDIIIKSNTDFGLG